LYNISTFVPPLQNLLPPPPLDEDTIYEWLAENPDFSDRLLLQCFDAIDVNSHFVATDAFRNLIARFQTLPTATTVPPRSPSPLSEIEMTTPVAQLPDYSQQQSPSIPSGDPSTPPAQTIFVPSPYPSPTSPVTPVFRDIPSLLTPPQPRIDSPPVPNSPTPSASFFTEVEVMSTVVGSDETSIAPVSGRATALVHAYLQQSWIERFVHDVPPTTWPRGSFFPASASRSRFTRLLATAAACTDDDAFTVDFYEPWEESSDFIVYSPDRISFAAMQYLIKKVTFTPMFLLNRHQSGLPPAFWVFGPPTQPPTPHLL
jgi:hypothetical protein